MGKIDEYLDKARELAEDAGDKAKKSAKEKVQGMLKDTRAGNEIRQGIKELESLPEFEGSILYKMELESAISDLKSLLLIINDNRLDDGSVIEEIRKVLDKVQPSGDQLAEDDTCQETDENQAIEKVKTIAYSACTKTLEAMELK